MKSYDIVTSLLSNTFYKCVNKKVKNVSKFHYISETMYLLRKQECIFNL